MNFGNFDSVLQALTRWAWQTSLSATFLILLVFLLQGLLRKNLPPWWQYALWMLVALRLILPFTPSSSFSVENFTLRIKSSFRSANPEPNLVHFRHGIIPLKQSAPEAVEPKQASPDRQSDLLTHDRAGVALVDATAGTGRFSRLSLLSYLWLAGAGSYLLIVLWQHRRFSQWLRRQTVARDPALVALVDNSKALLGVKRPVTLILTSASCIPALFGILHPRLLVTQNLTARPGELRLVLLHELAHLKRGDILQNWLLIVLQALHWFNPAVWLAFRRLRADRELVCDAMVLSRLQPAEWHAYGSALLSLFEKMSKPFPAPSLVPIINHKQQIRRRIVMITQSKPAPLMLTIALAVMVLALVGVTFTRAGDKPAAPSTNPAPGTTEVLEGEPPPPPPNSADVRIKTLQKEFDRTTEEVKQMEHKMDQMKLQLGISDSGAGPGSPAFTAENWRSLERLRIEAQAGYQEILSLYSQLTNMNRTRLRKTLPTASPDQQLISLFEQFNVADQKLAEASEKFGSDHPEVKRALRVFDKINHQIEERIDGILDGLKTKAAAYKTRVQAIEREVDLAKKIELDSSIRQRPYLQLKRDLETLQAVRDRLHLRIIHEKIEREIPSSKY